MGGKVDGRKNQATELKDAADPAVVQGENKENNGNSMNINAMNINAASAEDRKQESMSRGALALVEAKERQFVEHELDGVIAGRSCSNPHDNREGSLSQVDQFREKVLYIKNNLSRLIESPRKEALFNEMLQGSHVQNSLRSAAMMDANIGADGVPNRRATWTNGNEVQCVTRRIVSFGCVMNADRI